MYGAPNATKRCNMRSVRTRTLNNSESNGSNSESNGSTIKSNQSRIQNRILGLWNRMVRIQNRMVRPLNRIRVEWFEFRIECSTSGSNLRIEAFECRIEYRIKLMVRIQNRIQNPRRPDDVTTLYRAYLFIKPWPLVSTKCSEEDVMVSLY